MKFTTYADVLTPEHPISKAIAAGFKRNPGSLLRDVLRETGGRYEVTIELPLRFRDEVRQMVAQKADAELSALADTETVTISLEHLRGHDPDSTKIVYGCRLNQNPEVGTPCTGHTP